MPSQTELLYDLGLDDEVAGITKFCVHPQHWFRNKIKVGGTKNVNMKIIHDIHPDLIIANKEENTKEQIEELAKQYPVWISNIATLADAIEMIGLVGDLINKPSAAKKITSEIADLFLSLKNEYKDSQRAAYFIWRKPYMAAGGDTFINDMMKYCGLKNIFTDNLRYPRIDIEELKLNEQHTKGCELLLLSSEPFPFSQKHIEELQPYLHGTKIILADGEMFSWYGSRLLQAPGYFRRLLQEIQ